MDQKPYYTLDAWCKERYGEKLYKIALDAGLTCPNRDGTKGNRGCIFCSAGGSGDFAVHGISPALWQKNMAFPEQADQLLQDNIARQLAEGRSLLSSKKTGSRYIAYFQSYTNTYGPVAYLEAIYSAALRTDDIAGISIATRPDCLSREVLELLKKLKNRFPEKFIWIELGLQTIHESTAAYIRRGYPLSFFDEAVQKLQAIQIPVIVHVILGLPGETAEMVLATIRHLNQAGIWGIKLQLLHVLSGTDLAEEYQAGKFRVLSLDDYLDLLISCIRALSPDIVIHRVTGDGPKNILIAPSWSKSKRYVLNSLHHKMKLESHRQGQDYEPGTHHPL